VLGADDPGTEMRAQGAPVLAAVLDEGDVLLLGHCPADLDDRRILLWRVRGGHPYFHRMLATYALQRRP
jgi:hypothetical protein